MRVAVGAGVGSSRCGPDEWYMCVEVRELATLDNDGPAPAGTADEDLFYPCCF